MPAGCNRNSKLIAAHIRQRCASTPMSLNNSEALREQQPNALKPLGALHVIQLSQLDYGQDTFH